MMTKNHSNDVRHVEKCADWGRRGGNRTDRHLFSLVFAKNQVRTRFEREPNVNRPEPRFASGSGSGSATGSVFRTVQVRVQQKSPEPPEPNIENIRFVLQCIARGAEHLAITELELVTLAFAVLNMVTYALWWNKPQNVQCSFSVRISNASSAHANANVDVGDSKDRSMLARLRRTTREAWSGLDGSSWMNHTKKVSSFYAGENESERWIASLAGAAIAVVFGALHCIAWPFQFPSEEQEILWRIGYTVMVPPGVLLAKRNPVHST
ncbi:hypothetical protein BD410DRAFT_809277 [Rickenella mellea]|uniref:Uncharacterized protein n=1 Tax=Rickenella mellea TaxID=50990 RepID=A0A4Y7PIE5_9AGAM|nr:hypothetical protein BD410DRAFT_809277 [Rickenella mellea]